MKLLLGKVHRAVRAENSTGVISEIKSHLFWYNLSGIKYSLGWPAMFPWGMIRNLGNLQIPIGIRFLFLPIGKTFGLFLCSKKGTSEE